jgi:multicomponent Na+:H+ antiporter subunit C
MTAAVAVGILVAAGVYLILQRGLIRVAIGFVLLGHAANILLVAAGGMRLRGAPLLGDGPVSRMADPLPQAFVLTAIVITFGVTVYLLALVRAGGADESDDEPPDGPPAGGGRAPDTAPHPGTAPDRATGAGEGAG